MCDFISVGIKSAMRRLTETAEIDFSDAERSAVYTLIQKRNRLQHFGLEDSVQAVRAAAVRGLDFLITFTQQHTPER